MLFVFAGNRRLGYRSPPPTHRGYLLREELSLRTWLVIIIRSLLLKAIISGAQCQAL